MPTYTNPFGGGTITPSPASYIAIDLQEITTQLLWPGYLDVIGADEAVIAATVDFTTVGVGRIVLMPDARAASNGQPLLFNNQGANPLTIQSFDGIAIATINPGSIRLFYITDNSTSDGAWRSVLFGVGLGTLDVAGAAGFGLQANGAQLQLNRPWAEVSSDFNIVAGMRASLVVWVGGTGLASLPLSSGVGDGFTVALRNQGTGTLIVDANGGELVDGAATLALQPNESCELFTDGAGEWFTIGRGRNQQFNFTLLVKSITGGSVVLTPTEASNIVQQYIGVLVANAEIVLPSVVQVYYVSNQTSGAFSVSFCTAGVGTQVTVPSGQNAVLFCDGLNVINNSTTVSGLTSLLLAAGSVTVPSIAYSGDSSTGIYRPVAGSVGIVGLGGEVLRLTGVASGVNFLQVTNAVAAQHPSIAAIGADANVNITLTPKGTGGVGIGGTAVTKLHVFGGATTEARLQSSGDLTAGAAALLRFGGSNSAVSGYVGFGGGASTFDVVNALDGPTRFYTNNIERLRVLTAAAGRFDVVIGGTAAPDGAAGRGSLHINGGTDAILGLTIGGASKALLYNDDTNTTLLSRTSGALFLGANNAVSVTISAAGNMGVGAAPTGRFTVVTTGATGLNGSAWDSSAAVFGTGAGSPTGNGVAIGYNNATARGQIFSLAPTVAWRALEIGSEGLYILCGAGGLRFTFEPDGRIHGTNLHNNAGSMTGTVNQYVGSGTYTPTLTNTLNVAASSVVGPFQWIRVGNVVTVSGNINLQPTAGGNTATSLGISLPIASALSGTHQLAGSAGSTAAVAHITTGTVPVVAGDTVNDRATFQLTSVTTSNIGWWVTFTYVVV